MKTLDEIKEIIDNITYKKGWRFNLYVDGKRPVLQIVFDGADSVTGIIEEQKCRKWFLSYHMCNNEIIRTVHKAIMAAEEHETNEFFQYKNVRVMNPHFSYDDIVDLVNDNKLKEDTRNS